MGTGSFQPRDTPKAKALRNAATPAERRLWLHISRRQIAGAKFSRQMPIGPYVADFLCREQRLIVELDGYSHDLSSDRDAERTVRLESEGYRVVRFSNADVMANIEGVVLAIGAIIRDETSPHAQPLPQAGGELPA